MGVARRWARGVIVLVLWLGVTGLPAFAQDEPPAPDGSRVALVIGNSAYDTVGLLPNPVRDAEAIGVTLARLGFDVTEVNDLGNSGMRRALQEFELKAATAEIAVVFYAGHGIEIGGENFLIPVDARLERDTHVLDEAVPLSRVIMAVERASSLGLVILDACRNNPFAAQMVMTDASRAVGRGLARIEPGGSILVAYAAKEGTIADDGDGEHSPYTAALLAHLETPGLEVSFLFRRVRDDVILATGGEQEPFVYGTLGGAPIYFVEDTQQAPQLQANAEGPAQNAGQDGLGNVAAAYEAALAINTIAAWDAFLRYFPSGYYTDLAVIARDKLLALGPVGPDGEPIGEPDLPVFVEEPQLIAAAPLPLPADGDEAVIARCDTLTAYRYDPDRPPDILPVAVADVTAQLDAAREACTAALEVAPDLGRLHFQLARVFAITGDYPAALERYRVAAELGSAAAMNEIGLYYRNGTAVAVDIDEAIDWLTRAAGGGSTDAMINLGDIYDQGEEVAVDLDEAGRWFRMAADAGHPEGYAALGYRYDYGRGVERDQAEARRLYRLAAEAGSSYGMVSLGYLYDWGLGGEADYAEAAYWYEQASLAGNSYGTSNLGYVYEDGRGVEADLGRARTLYEQAAAAGNPYAMYNLGRLYQDGIGVTQDYDRAFRWYQQAADGGHFYAMNRLGILYDNGWGVAEPDPEAARLWWEQAADNGVGDALHNLGYLYETGRGVARDLERAGDYYVAALDRRNAATIDEFMNYADAYAVAVRRKVEQFLIDLGLLSGRADGQIDDATRNALLAWRDG
ncbi:MAG: SEL1-like repeat protein [Bauldia sp.]|nr:SEL1-like repeat protein [Bauldia sp.]